MVQRSCGRQWLLAGLVVLWCGGLRAQAQPAPTDCDCDLPALQIIADFVLDVGAFDDDNAISRDMFVIVNPPSPPLPHTWDSWQLGDRQSDICAINEYDCRTGRFVTATSYSHEKNPFWYSRLVFGLKKSAIAQYLDANGVPTVDVVIDVTYIDNVPDCKVRPFLQAKLDYGNPSDPGEPLEWQPLGAIAGRNDNAWHCDRIFIPHTYWQTMRATTITLPANQPYGMGGQNAELCVFRIIVPRLEADVLPSVPIDCIKVRFVEHDSFESLRELDRCGDGVNDKGRYLIRKEHIESNSPGNLPVGPTPPPYVIFKRNYLEKFYPNTVPAPDELTSGLDLFEVAGEREPVTFGLYAFEDLTNVTVTADASMNPVGGGTAVDFDLDEPVQINPLVAMDYRWDVQESPYFAQQNVVLGDNIPLGIAEETTQQYWVTVPVPSGCPAGIYEFNLTIAADGRPQTVLPVRVTVFNVTLGSPDVMPYMIMGDPYYPGTQRATDRMSVIMNEADHGVYPVLYFKVTIEDLNTQTPTVNWGDWDGPKGRLAQLAAGGMLPPKLRLVIVDNWSALWDKKAVTCGLPTDTPRFSVTCPAFDVAYKHVLRTYWDTLVQYGPLPGVGFEEIGVTIGDEPGVKEGARQGSTYLYRLVHEVAAEAPGDRHFTTWCTYYDVCEKPLAGHTFTFDAVAAPINEAMVLPLIIQNDAVAYWPFQSDLLDAKGSHHASPNGTPSPAPSGGCLTFNGGSEHYVEVAHAADL